MSQSYLMANIWIAEYCGIAVRTCPLAHQCYVRPVLPAGLFNLLAMLRR